MSDKKEWMVTVPIVGRMTVYVTAADEAEAEEMAMAGEWEENEILETEIVRQCRGNVCHLQGGVDVEENA